MLISFCSSYPFPEIEPGIKQTESGYNNHDIYLYQDQNVKRPPDKTGPSSLVHEASQRSQALEKVNLPHRDQEIQPDDMGRLILHEGEDAGKDKDGDEPVGALPCAQNNVFDMRAIQ
ncbi:MAG: hypothetical protein MZV49_15330 [Rhodopseudomonas palustris]|nr:hypothetical protein [Rhodopseudomonas palustris]